MQNNAKMITLKHIAKHSNVSHPRIVHKLKSIKESQCPPHPLGEIKVENEQIKQIRSSSKRISLTFLSVLAPSQNNVY